MKTPAPGEDRDLSFHSKAIKTSNCSNRLRTVSKRFLKDGNLKVNKRPSSFSAQF